MAAVVCLMMFGVLGVSVFSSMVGQFEIPASDVIRAVARKFSGGAPEGGDLLSDSVLWNVRFPRIVLGLVVGMALGASGAMMQAVFGNPLAEPGVVGISAGAAVGACVAIVLGTTIAGIFTVPLFAFVAALGVTAVVYWLSRTDGRAGVIAMILTGIAVTAVANAVIAMLVFMADSSGRDQIVFWQMGSLNGATWTAVASSLPAAAIGLVGALSIAGSLDLLALGERAAQHSGIHVERLRGIAIACTAILTGTAVAHAGIIAFVGLIVPHVLRLALGPSNRILIPASAVGGALLIAASDVAARTVVPFADLPIGIFTALVGGPTFFVLLRRSLRQGEAAWS